MDESRTLSLVWTELFRADCSSFRDGRALLYFDAGKDVIDIVVGGQGDLVQGACLNALDDFLAGEVEDRLQNLRALLLVRLPHDEEHARAVLDVAGRKQLLLQDLHDDGRFGAVKAAWIAAAVQLGEELRCPFVVVVPQLFEQLRGEAGPGLDLGGVYSRYDPILGERRSLEVAVPSDGGLVMDEAPQPRHIDPVGGEVIHEPQRKFVVVDRRREVAVEDLEAVVRRHVERVLDALNGDLTLRYAVDGVPKFLREKFLRRVKHALGDDQGHDLALRVQ